MFYSAVNSIRSDRLFNLCSLIMHVAPTTVSIALYIYCRPILDYSCYSYGEEGSCVIDH